MFTGIVAALGRIAEVQSLGDGARLRVDMGTLPLEDAALGDSIAVSGVCLTLIERIAQRCAFDVSRETFACTTGLRQIGAEVNLERALRMGDSIGGHLLTGHVDGIGSVVAMQPQAQHLRMRVRAPASLERFFARKGSVAVNGVSLTINDVAGAEFEVNLIPHTLNATNLKGLSAGSAVNLEIDLIARYVERMLGEVVR